jgi:tetratricopeptide (TPR) repeat protein
VLWIAHAAASTVLPVQKTSSLPEATDEDTLIMRAILREDAGDYNASRHLYERLFTLTGKKEYLIREAQDALASKQNIARSIANLTRWVTEHPTDHDKQLYLVLAGLYIQNDALREADEIVDTYLTQGDVETEALQEFGSLKIQLGEYEDALKLLKQAYEQSPDEETATDIAAVYVVNLKQPEKAIAFLEHHLQNDPNASVGFYFRLIELYAKASRIDKVLALYKQLYRRDPQNYFLQKIIEISLYLKDTDGLIRFLEETKGNESLLYSIYKEYGLFDKAIDLARRMYGQTHDPKWVAEEAILTYEKADRKHLVTPEVLERMSALFEQAFAEGVAEPVYLNYYGYTLIDRDMQIDKGIGLVRRALGADPNNIYYLDSLAWGLYKKGQCQNAYKLIRRVVAKGSRKEPEIIDHYRAIKACLKRR